MHMGTPMIIVIAIILAVVYFAATIVDRSNPHD